MTRGRNGSPWPREHGMSLNCLVLEGVKGGDACRTGIVIMKLPAGDLAILAHTTADFDDRSGTKVGPGKLLFARPNYLDRPLRGTRQSGSLDGGFACVLPTITGAGIRHQDTDSFFWHTDRRGEFRPYTKGTLCTGPYRQIVARPLRQRCPRFERSMCNVVSHVGLLQAMIGRRQRLVH